MSTKQTFQSGWLTLAHDGWRYLTHHPFTAHGGNEIEAAALKAERTDRGSKDRNSYRMDDQAAGETESSSRE